MPDGMTLRQLMPMVLAHRRAQWAVASNLLAMIYNAHDASGKTVTAEDMNPYSEKRDEDGDVIHLTMEEAKVALQQLCIGAMK